jgi:hypothetical protein
MLSRFMAGVEMGVVSKNSNQPLLGRMSVVCRTTADAGYEGVVELSLDGDSRLSTQPRRNERYLASIT